MVMSLSGGVTMIWCPCSSCGALDGDVPVWWSDSDGVHVCLVEHSMVMSLSGGVTVMVPLSV